jgi:hypothetical protein
VNQDQLGAEVSGVPEKRYPDYMMPIAGSLPERHRRFASCARRCWSVMDIRRRGRTERPWMTTWIGRRLVGLTY